MKKIYVTLSLLVLFASCSAGYKIKGESSVSSLDDKMLYIKSFKSGTLKTVDSAEVVHGFFEMKGAVDSTEMVMLFMDENIIMPFVLEEGSIRIKIDNAHLRAEGTPLNNTLYDFFSEKSKIDSRVDELEHMEAKMILNGDNPDYIQTEKEKIAREISNDMTALVKNFLMKNSQNVLGPGVFLLLCQSTPVMTPEIEEILSELPASFCDDPLVNKYVTAARDNLLKLQEHHRQMAAEN